MFIISGIWYIYYKMQGVASFLIPSVEDPLEKLQYEDFYVMLFIHFSQFPSLSGTFLLYQCSSTSFIRSTNKAMLMSFLSIGKNPKSISKEERPKKE